MKEAFMDDGKSINRALMLIPSLLLAPPTFLLRFSVSPPELARPPWMDSKIFLLDSGWRNLLQICTADIFCTWYLQSENPPSWIVRKLNILKSAHLSNRCFIHINIWHSYWQPGARNTVMLADAFGHASEYNLVCLCHSHTITVFAKTEVKSSSSPTEAEYKTEQVP